MGLRDEMGWRRDGDTFKIDWAGSTWSLQLVGDRLGVRDDARGTMVLALAGQAVEGRSEGLRAADLADLEIVQGRLQAVYTPQDWHGLTVRAAWGLSRDGQGLDLEVQASTSSVGALSKLEVLVETRFQGAEDDPAGLLTVEDRLQTGPVPRKAAREASEGPEELNGGDAEDLKRGGFPPLFWSPGESKPAASYMEIVHPHDVSRRLLSEVDGAVTSARYALLGYDLERGVVLRGRLRGLWFPTESPTPEQLDQEQSWFLNAPLPLRTD